MTDLELIDIDPDGKKITITNNRRLYEAIASGATAVVIPRILMWLQSVVEATDATLGAGFQVVTLIFEATYQYLIQNWELAHSVTVSGHLTATATATARPVIK